MTEELILGSANYTARVTPLKTGGRRDVEVATSGNMPQAFGRSDILAQLRRFFSDLEAEAATHAGDPVALSQALARMEALLSDVRYVRDTMRTLAAESLAAERVRRLTVSGVVTVEATSETKRSGWDHRRLFAQVLDAEHLGVLDRTTGEVITGTDAADKLLETLRPEWRMTNLKALGINPDEYCTVAADDDGRPIRTPSVRIVDNIVRRITTPTTTQETNQ